jgi:hypothetical protein
MPYNLCFLPALCRGSQNDDIGVAAHEEQHVLKCRLIDKLNDGSYMVTQ